MPCPPVRLSAGLISENTERILAKFGIAGLMLKTYTFHAIHTYQYNPYIP
jgi:hypothetical protein